MINTRLLSSYLSTNHFLSNSTSVRFQRITNGEVLNTEGYSELFGCVSRIVTQCNFTDVIGPNVIELVSSQDSMFTTCICGSKLFSTSTKLLNKCISHVGSWISNTSVIIQLTKCVRPLFKSRSESEVLIIDDGNSPISECLITSNLQISTSEANVDSCNSGSWKVCGFTEELESSVFTVFT